MEFKGTQVSGAYYQLYLTLSKEEMNIVIEDSKMRLKTFLIDEKTSQVTALSKLGLRDFNTFRKIKKLKDEIQELSNDQYPDNFDEQIDFFVREVIETTFDEEIENREMILVGPKQINYLGHICLNQPLSVTCSFCFVPSQFELKLPIMKVAKVPITEDDLKTIINEILIYKGYCTFQESEYIQEYSDIIIDIIYEDSTKNMYNHLEDVNNLSERLGVDIDLFLGKKKNDIILIDDENDKIEIIIHDIIDKIPMELSDEIVANMNLLGLRTIDELTKKMKEIYSYVLNINVCVITILKAIAKINDFKIDSYVIHHFEKELNLIDLGQLGDELSFQNEGRDSLSIQFVTAVIFYSFYPEESKYDNQLKDEFEILKMIKPELFKDKTLEGFMEFRRPFLVLYEYFELKGLL